MKKFFYKITKKYWNSLSYEHAKKNNFIVQNGVFKNLKINDNISWGRGDVGSKIYGFYENKIQKKLKELRKPILIDIGAADGFFAVGCLHAKLSKYCYAFEQNEKSRSALFKTAKMNSVDNQISIMGKVDNKTFLSLLPKDLNLSNVVILCDIEGEEYNFFSETILKKLTKCNLIIEIHNENSNLRETDLLKIVKKYFKVTVILDNDKDMSEIKILHKLNDIDRNLIVCEGRSYIGKWWHLSPK
jgi:hypothetical protein|tara:strand:- start:618 stop:1349 length:732 start_codon:yes stop_codon:yes gene_type:complete